MKKIVLALVAILTVSLNVRAQEAPAPLFRDPITDGAADPVLVWNREEGSWWMLYTQRRANVETADVAYCYGNDIGIASTQDHGQTWVYRGTLDLEFERGKNTFWAPDVVYHQGVYHMFVSYIQGVRNHWSGRAKMAHYVSTNLWDWEMKGFVKLLDENVIDASLYQMAEGNWKMWFKSHLNGGTTMTAESSDLYDWLVDKKPAIAGGAHEGPKAFRFAESYWMLTDEWHGLMVHRSDDLKKWESQNLILTDASSRFMDGPMGAHADVLTLGEKAYVFYFTHPGRTSHGHAPMDHNGNIPLDLRRSVIQVGELVKEGEGLRVEREVFDFYLPNLDDMGRPSTPTDHQGN